MCSPVGVVQECLPLVENGFMDGLIKVDFQYQVRWLMAFNFTAGECVFLKSNPEFPLTVEASGRDGKVIVSWVVDGDKVYAGFDPEMILQYKYRPLLVWKDKYKVCLN